MNTKSKLLMNKHLHNVEEVLRCSNATPFRGYEGQGYRCCYCTQQCMKPGDLKAHTALTHEGIKKAYFGYAHIEKFNIKLDITDLHCTLCGSTIDNIEALVNHLINDHNKLIHTDIKSHIIPFKFDGGEGLRCFICSNRFNAFKALLEHMKLHIRNFVCQVCDAGFINRSQLRYHFQTHKTGTFKCDHCEKVFSTSLKCKSHMRSVHEKSVINKCGFCEATFVSYRHKQKHQLEEHGVDCQVKCEACGRSFQSQGSYRKHLRANHLMERRFECTFCDLKFFTVTGLNRHMVKHTGARDFKCDVCHKAFGRRNTLREHMRIHTDDRRFKCEYCGLAFVQKCSWRGHMRSRHGEEV
ncbi:unnamed protein product [Leptosia nina]|uniref:C2H2-type domain-containing protein n=1 Tax=Leptosia nina TaxID=320188 RepID=A0AAV1K1R6_9NEOP